MHTNTGSQEEWVHHLRKSASTSDRNWWVTFWLSLFFGMLGADRFYLGSPVLAILKLFTFGGGFLWWGLDLILLLSGQMRDAENKYVRRIV